ncbi:MAG: 4'-phosphopantetheinyl transferase superfamily protein [Bacteroidetes bacterium]|nr:4'-phosphopantetheinyl transferase superfamily protein [Bacteroidota bacterium]MBS1630493.1 4'-phosphopantetheinyl transferase superfamily protein [Bacteroidota bacterium]
MSLYREWTPGPQARAAIWQIEEDEAFFQEKTGWNTSIRHPRKRLEHLCGRWLLQHLRDDFPLQQIAPDDHDKPRLPADELFFSISHSFPYVAAVVSEQEECGIDIQVWRERMNELAHMFLSEEEQSLFRQFDEPLIPVKKTLLQESQQADGSLLTLAWCAKEAAYKWNGRRGTDFILQLPIRSIVGTALEQSQEPHLHNFTLEMRVNQEPVILPAWIEKDFACAYLLRSKYENFPGPPSQEF